MPNGFKPVKMFSGSSYTCVIDNKNNMMQTGYLRYTCDNSQYMKVYQPDEWCEDKDGDGNVIKAALNFDKIDISYQNIWALMSNGSLWYRGYTNAYAFPGNSDVTNWTRLPMSLDDDEQIVDM